MAKPRVALDIEIPSDVKYIEQVVELATRECRELHLPPRVLDVLGIQLQACEAELGGDAAAIEGHVDTEARARAER